MFDLGHLLDDEVSGSTAGDVIEATAWRGGVPVATGLQLSSWDLGWDESRQVQGQATVTVADPDGTLAPWSLADPLGPGGSRLQLTWVSGSSGVRVVLGWWRLRVADPLEQWRIIAHETGPVRVSGGGSVTLNLDELTCIPAELDRLDGEGNPPAGATCLSEVRRLLAGIMPVTADPAIVDRAVPSSLTYGDGRMDAVVDLLTQVDATYRMTSAGALEVIPTALGTPVWQIAGGEDGVLVDVRRRLSDESVYNAVASTGTTPEGTPIVGRDRIKTGPLAWGVDQPFGRVLARHQSIATTQAGVDADAATRLASLSAAGQVDLPVTCLTHPGIQLHDTVTVVAATTAGDAPLLGRVVAKRMSSADGAIPAKAMTLSVRVSTAALEAVAARVARG